MVKLIFPQWRLLLGKLRALYRDCCSIIRRHPFVVVIFIIILIVIGFYYVNFQYLPERNKVWWPFFQYLSEKNEDWGTFGDYVGGILNPVIAAFAFYLIAKTYELQIKAYDLQETELEETRKLLKVSTDAQNDQVKLAALTALISTNLARIDFLNFEKTELLNALVVKPNAIDTRSIEELGAFEEGVEKGYYREDYPVRQRVRKIYGEIKCLTDKTNKFEEQIEVFLKGKAE